MFFHRNDGRHMALDLVSSNIMIADTDLNITYINDALRAFFDGKQDQLETTFPGFDVEHLIGTNIDTFHQNPEDQRHAIAKLKAAHEATISIGDATFDLIAQPIADRRGRRLGTIVEWRDAELRLQNIDYRAQVEAIMRSQAVIRFEPDGTVYQVNDNFLAATGYERDEVIGQHHRMFVEPEEAQSADYAAFWQDLRGGAFKAGEFRRRNKQGDTIWLNATYNPLFDDAGRIKGVIKFANDMTDEKRRQQQRAEAQETIAEDLAIVAGNVSEASRQAQEASVSSETASTSVQSNSAAVEELSASVSEIERQVVHASGIATDAVDQAERTNTIVSTLTNAAKEIESVVNLISDIAEQTNLLALNATIEAARAGEAGRGFAVVAAEVKDLASQTGKATEEITSRIANVQKTSVDAVDAIAEISQTIAKINEISSAISSAVEEQAATTAEMSGTMQTTARDVQSIDGLMRGIADALESIDETTQKVKTAAAALG
ncbi:MAG: PAS domain-containing methyl-accepting chemotaxis protein [Pseudomonadota bacterium]